MTTRKRIESDAVDASVAHSTESADFAVPVLSVPDAYALPEIVATALSAVQSMADAVPVPADQWDALSGIARVDRVGTALVAQGLGKRPVLDPQTGEVLTGVSALSRALGFSGHATVSHWVTALGYLQDSDTTVSAESHSHALAAYNGGKAYRENVKSEIVKIRDMTDQGARAARWAEIGQGAAAARIAEANSKRTTADDVDAEIEVRAPQVPDGSDAALTFESWFGDLSGCADRVIGDGEGSPFALTNDRADAVRDVLLAIASALAVDLTVSA